MGVQSQSALIAALVLLGLCINVLFERRRVEHRAAFASMVSAFALFNLSWFFYAVTGTRFWVSLLLVSAVAISLTCISFFERVLSITMPAIRTLATTISCVLLVVSITDFCGHPAVVSGAVILGLGTYGWCIWCLYRRYQSTVNPVESTRLGYLVFGGSASVALSAIDLLPSMELPSPALGHIFTTVYLYFWMQVVLRSRLMDLKELVGRGLALLALSAAISLIYVALLVWVENSLGLFFFNTVAASVIVFLVFEPLKRVLDLWVGKLLFRPTHELQAALNSLDRKLVSVISLEDLIAKVIDGLQASRRITHASVFLLEGSGHTYSLPTPEARLGQIDIQRLDIVRERSFIDALQRDGSLSREQVSQELIDLEDVSSDSPLIGQLKSIHRTMSGLSAGLTFAFRSGDRLLGFLNLRDEHRDEAFSTFEIGLLNGVANRITRALENSELVRELKERDRLSALGEMATGMAHEIRNPLGAIKSAAQLLDPPAGDNDARKLFDVIVDEANRLDNVLTQFLNFARPFRGALQPVDVHGILERVSTLIKAEQDLETIEIRLEASDDLPYVIGDPDQLHQVCLNLARNACQAMSETGGTLSLQAAVVLADRPGRPGQQQRRLEVRIADTGPGIPDGVVSNIFIPFFTTKRDGTGLGLPISQRLLQHHGSEIRVASTREGTTMSFRLILESDADQLTGEHRRLLALGPST